MAKEKEKKKKKKLALAVKKEKCRWETEVQQLGKVSPRKKAKADTNSEDRI